MKSKSAPATKQISPSKRRLFTAIVLLMPIALLLITEALLRQFEFGGNLDLVTKKHVGGREFYAINRSVGQRYFAHSGTVVPEPADDIFEINKSKNTKRIFCLGESTMAGFPYEFNATAPSFLRDRLKSTFPEYNIEVINAGLSAVGSYIVCDFIEELVDYEPDLFIVYVGHNEFYGAYGVGSFVTANGGPWVTRLTISLLKFKTFLALRDAYAWLRETLTHAQSAPRATLMEQMVGELRIPYHSSLYQEARRIYRENLASIIKSAQSRGVPIIISTLVSNVRDQPPFEPVFGENTSEESRTRWTRYIAVADSLMAVGLKNEAVDTYRAAVSIDTSNAFGFYKLGQALYQLDKFQDAGRALLRAKDLDALRFRMSEEFQSDLLEICRSYNVPIAHLDSAFKAASPHGLVGRELLLEHLHPNIEGYFLMGKTFFNAIVHNNLLVQPREWNRPPKLKDNDYWKMSTVSDFDRITGQIKINTLTHRWPFTSERNDYQFVPADPVEEIVYRYVRGKLTWQAARYEVAEFYADNGLFDLARRECLAISKVIPFSYEPLLRVADYFRMEGRIVDAKEVYMRSFEAEDNPFARVKLAIILLEEDHPAEAASHIEMAFELDAQTRYKLPVAVLVSGRYLLGVAYARLGKVKEARERLREALAIDPGCEDAQLLLQELGR